jgi:class 3 adenylate cyclase/predicted ATPase
MHCSRCGHDNKDGAKFCNECGSPLPLVCFACGTENPTGAKFCNECGALLSTQPQVPNSKSQVPNPQRPTPNTQHLTPGSQSPASYTPKHLAERILAEQAALEARGAPDGERKTITALFADIKDSTALIEDLDPEDARRIIDPALKLMMDAVHRYEGYVAQSLGDGIFALFGAPIAHEDHAQRALYAALLMQEESRKQAERLRLEKGVNVQIRVGVNTGEVVVRSIRKDDLHTDYVPIGHSTNIAARMENLATPGAIVVSEYTHKLTEGYFEFKSLGAAQVKGASDPLKIYEVTGVGPLRTKIEVAVRRGLARFVGRQREMEQLSNALDHAKAGHGQIAGVMGEPGVGKSRLFYEFVGARRAVPLHAQDCLLLETFSVSHGKAYPYLPLIDLLKNYFQLAAQDDERKRREKITGKVLTLDRALEETLPYLFHLLGITEPTSSLQQMDPQIRRQRTLEAIKRLLLRESLNQPVILVFEDLHWLDNETQAFLSLLGESIASARILLLVNYRPEYRHDWGNKTYYTQLRLDPLGKQEAEEMLAALLAEKVGATGRSPLHEFILDKTEGNPFFMEEIVQALVEQDVLTRDAVGAHGRAPLPTDIHIPPTVQAVLASRIDRLSPEEKNLLQTLAVIGKTFSLSLLKQVVDHSEDTLHRLLARLRDAEFIYEQPAFPEPDYTFKHALTQEVAYNSMLVERRKGLHERAAQAIETLFPLRLDDHYSELASHYSRSGSTQKAVDYLHLAGQQAVQRSAYTEAIDHLTKALEFLDTLHPSPERFRQELPLQTTLGRVLSFTKGQAASEVGQAYARAQELCQQVGETPQLLAVLHGLRLFHLGRAELQTARELAEQLLHLAQSMQDQPLLIEAHRGFGATLYWRGEFTLAREHLERGIALFDPQHQSAMAFVQGGVSTAGCLSILAWALWFLGYPDQALQRSHEAPSLARDLSHLHILAFALNGAAMVYQFRREGRAAEEQAEALVRFASEQGFAQQLSTATAMRGWALAEQGQGEEGITLMRQGLTALQASGSDLLRLYFLVLLAETYGKVGQTEKGLSTLAEALAFVEKYEERFYEAELYRLKGELTLQLETRDWRLETSPSSPQAPSLKPQDPGEVEQEAEECFLKAIDIARKQQAKSLELRATMSLVRLRQRQATQYTTRHTPHEAPKMLDAARNMLSDVYNWFTEGFDTKDLQEAKALLEELERQKGPKQGRRKNRKRDKAKEKNE